MENNPKYVTETKQEDGKIGKEVGERRKNEKGKMIREDEMNKMNHTIIERNEVTQSEDELKITNLINISDTFNKSLLENIKSGSYFQQEQILSIKSKIILFSLAIQEKIQKIETLEEEEEKLK